MGLELPWRRLESEGRAEEGPGDAVLHASWRPSDLGLFAGLRLPTGQDDLDRFRGVRGKVVPLGNGTLDLLLGASYRSAPFFDTLLLSIPLTDAEEEPPPGVELGTASAFSVFNRAGAGTSIAEPLAGWLALDVQWKDDVRHDGGGTNAWLTPGLTLGPVEIYVQIPLAGGHAAATLALALSW